MIDRERHIGIVSEPRVVDVEAGFLKFFAKATGETDPVYFDDAAARAAGPPLIPVPPTYFFSVPMIRPATRGDIFDKEKGLGVDIMRHLHCTEGCAQTAPATLGDAP